MVFRSRILYPIPSSKGNRSIVVVYSWSLEVGTNVSQENSAFIFRVKVTYILKTEAACSSEMLVSTCKKTTWHENLGDLKVKRNWFPKRCDSEKQGWWISQKDCYTPLSETSDLTGILMLRDWCIELTGIMECSPTKLMFEKHWLALIKYTT